MAAVESSDCIPAPAVRMRRMLAYEVLVNGRRVCIAAAGTSLGANVLWSRNRPSPLLFVEGTEIDASGGDWPIWWPAQHLSVGDEVTIRIIETDSRDPPTQDLSTHPSWKFRGEEI